MTKKNGGGSRNDYKNGKNYLRGVMEMEALASGRGKAGSGYAQKKIGQIQEARRQAAEDYRAATEGKPLHAKSAVAEVKPREEDSIAYLFESLDDAIERDSKAVKAQAVQFDTHGILVTNFYTSGATKEISGHILAESIQPEANPTKRHKPCALLAVRGAEVESPYTRKSYEWELSRVRGYTDRDGELTKGDIQNVKATGTVAQMIGLLRDWEQGAKSGGHYKQTLPGGTNALHHSKVDPYRLPGSISHIMSESRAARRYNL